MTKDLKNILPVTTGGTPLMSRGVTRGDLATLRGKEGRRQVMASASRECWVCLLCITSLKSCFLLHSLHFTPVRWRSTIGDAYLRPQTKTGQASLEAWGVDLEWRGIEVAYIGVIYWSL